MFGEENVCVIRELSFTRETPKSRDYPTPAEFMDALAAHQRPDPDIAWVIRQIPKLTELRGIDATGTNVTDEDLAGWNGLDKLQTLKLQKTFVQDPSAWPQWPLRFLDVSQNFITDDHAAGLAKYKSLQRLNIRATAITDLGFADLSTLSELEILDVSHSGITPESIDVVQSFPKLDLFRAYYGTPNLGNQKGWDLFTISRGNSAGDGIKVTDSAYISIKAEFPLNTAGGTEKTVHPFLSAGLHPEYLRQRQDVETLMLEMSIVSGSDFQNLKLLPNLKRLELNQMVLEQSCYQYIDDLPALISLDLRHSAITDAGFANIVESIPRLEELDLGATMLTDKSLEKLRDAHSLRKLSLDGTLITDEGLANLARLNQLESITLPPERIRGPGLRHLLQLPNLRSVTFLADDTDEAGWRTRWRYPVAQPVTLQSSEDLRYFKELARHLADRADQEFLDTQESMWAKDNSLLRPQKTEHAILVWLLRFHEITPGAQTLLFDGGKSFGTVEKARPKVKIRRGSR